ATAPGAMTSATTTARAASFGNPDEPPQGAINAKNRESVTDPGPQNPALATQFPSAQSPPPTDVGDLPQFWASFNNAPRRIQNGGWARQVTQDDFAISETISGVNMRLAAGGIRELHWHLAAEWARSRRQGPRLCLGREGRRPLVLSCGLPAFTAGARSGGLRVHHFLRRRQSQRIQHNSGDGLARPHAS